MTEPTSFDRFWDVWCRQRNRCPALSVEEFAELHPTANDDLIDLLRIAIALEGEGKLDPLIELLNDPLPEDFQFAGFALENRIGQGGAGIVYRARAPEGVRVALKILNPLAASSRQWKESILHEARVASRLDHPAFVTVKGCGVERGYAWIASELVEGEPLDSYLIRSASRAQALSRAVRIGQALCDALQHAHDHGIVHRDLKPSNIVIAETGPRVLDLGLAHETGCSTRTMEGPVGTPVYMAPEQHDSNASVGPAADQWALGLILAEIAALRLLPTTAQRREAVRRMDHRLRAVVLRATEFDPRDRYSSLAEMAMDLRAIESGDATIPGARSMTSRGLLRLKRHPVISALVVFLAIVPFSIIGYTRWTRPQLVHINTLYDGKEISIDGEVVGVTPLAIALPPGEYDYQMSFNSSDREWDVRSGRLHVRRGEPLYEFMFIDEPRYIDPLPGAQTNTPPDRGNIWFAVGPEMPADLRISIAGREYRPERSGCWIDVEGGGPHRVRVQAAGCRSIEHEVTVVPGRTSLLAFELDPIDSEYHTSVIYGPSDIGLRDLQVKKLRMCVEFLAHAGIEDHVAHKLFLAPTENWQSGEATFWVDLPKRVSESIEVRWFADEAVFGRTGWSQVEVGPEPDELYLLIRRAAPQSDRPSVLDPDPRFYSAMGGRDRLYFRVSCGGAPVGETTAYASSLRTSGLPRQYGTKSIWSPSFRIRVR